MAKKSTKINVTVSFSVDLDAWANEYGLEPDQARDDAKEYLPQIVRAHVNGMPHVQLGIVDYLNRTEI